MNNFVDVYVRKIPFKTTNNDIFPIDRKIEIDSCTNEKIKQEKFYVWKLLEYGINKSLGIKIKDIKFVKNKTKWECDKFKFSLSHSNNIVAVVIAKNDIGIDIEKWDINRFKKIPTSRILNESEILIHDGKAETLNKLWTVKEAVYKKGNGEYFNPCKIDTLKEKHITRCSNIDGEKYYISVATNDINLIKFNLGENVFLEEKE